MKRAKLIVAPLAVLCCLLAARDVRAQTVDGYTSIQYDETSGIVTAYSETTVDYDLMYDYQAYVSLTVTDSYGTVKASRSARDVYDSGFISVVVQFYGDPDTTYTARGAHKGYAQLYNYDYDYSFYPYRQVNYYYDYWWFGFYEGQGIYRPWYYTWFNNGFREVTRRTRLIPLGTTYDYDSVTTPGELKLTMSGAQTVKDGSSPQFSVTVEGGTATNYEWSARWPSRVGNNPNVTFNPASGSSSVTTNAHWFASPNSECGASFNAQYTIKCTVTFSNGKKKSAETTLTVNAEWNPAGKVDPNEARITGAPSMGQDASGVWRVTGMGTLGRRIPAKQVFVPNTSQFFTKADAHEQEHLNHWSQGSLFGNVHQPADFYARIQNFTGATQQELLDKIVAEFQVYTQEQDNFVNANVSQSEKLAYAVSDPINPKYLYQNCGRY